MVLNLRRYLYFYILNYNVVFPKPKILRHG